MARLAPDPYPGPWTEELPVGDGKFMARYEAEEKALTELFERSAKLPEGQIEGAVLRWQRGDGYAFYVVTKEQPLTLAWVPFMDRWSVESALIRGLTKADVLQQLDWERALAKMFGRDS